MSSKIRSFLPRFVVLLSIGVVAGAQDSPGPSVQPLAVTAGGDTCASPTPIVALPYNDSGDTTGATNQSLFLNSACSDGLGVSREGPDLIYTFSVFAGNSLTFVVDPSDKYDVSIYILGTCGVGSTCVEHRDVGLEGQPETIGPMTFAPGTYYLFIDSVYGVDEINGSGTYTLSVTGSLGVPNNTSFYTLTPCRILDTRDPAGPFGGPALSAGVVRTFTIPGQCSVPASAKSISVNATITQPTAQGHVVLFPGGAAVPTSSTINFRAGQTRANNAIVPLGTSGTLSAVSGQPAGNTVHFILDVNGYFQ
jgi:hypothetical protein